MTGRESIARHLSLSSEYQRRIRVLSVASFRPCYCVTPNQGQTIRHFRSENRQDKDSHETAVIHAECLSTDPERDDVRALRYFRKDAHWTSRLVVLHFATWDRLVNCLDDGRGSVPIGCTCFDKCHKPNASASVSKSRLGRVEDLPVSSKAWTGGLLAPTRTSFTETLSRGTK